MPARDVQSETDLKLKSDVSGVCLTLYASLTSFCDFCVKTLGFFFNNIK